MFKTKYFHNIYRYLDALLLHVGGNWHNSHLSYIGTEPKWQNFTKLRMWSHQTDRADGDLKNEKNY